MRLTTHYQTVITAEALRVFGEDSTVYLFGSRLDDSKKGGDIDLFILREIRNDIAHDYGENPEQGRQILNKIYQCRTEMKNILKAIELKANLSSET